jgi:hypothetical protein
LDVHAVFLEFLLFIAIFPVVFEVNGVIFYLSHKNEYGEILDVDGEGFNVNVKGFRGGYNVNGEVVDVFMLMGRFLSLDFEL